MANSLGPTPDKKEQIARWTGLIEKYEREIAGLQKTTTPATAVENAKKIAHLEKIIAEYKGLIKDNQDYLDNKERQMRALYDKFINRK